MAALSPATTVPNPQLQIDSNPRTSPALLLPPSGSPGVHCPGKWALKGTSLSLLAPGKAPLHTQGLKLAQPCFDILTHGRLGEPGIGQEEVARVRVVQASITSTLVKYPEPWTLFPGTPTIGHLSKLLIAETPSRAPLYHSHTSPCPCPQVSSRPYSEIFPSTSWKPETQQTHSKMIIQRNAVETGGLKDPKKERGIGQG